MSHAILRNHLVLLLADTDGPATTTSGLGVLTTDAEAPVVTKTSVGADLLQSLEIITELGVDAVGEDLEVLAVNDIALSVEEPGGDLVLGGVLDDGDDVLKLFRGKLTGAAIVLLDSRSPCLSASGVAIPLVKINIGLLADQVGVATSNTLYLGQSEHDLLFSINLECVR